MSRTLYLYNDTLFEVKEEFTYTGHPEEFTVQPGTYLMMCYGARGGHSDINRSEYGMPLGGMAMGVITFNEATTLYAVVGGDGQTGNTDNLFTPGGYNGGGRGGKSVKPTQWNSGPSGGGSTDIRLNVTPESIVSSTVIIPNDYTVLDQLCSKYNNYFDTGYIPKASTTLEIDFEYLPANWYGTQNLFGLFNTIPGGPYKMLYSFCLRANDTDLYRSATPGGFETDYWVGSITRGRVIYNFTETEITWHSYGSDTVYHSEDSNIGCTSFDFDTSTYTIPTLAFFGQHKTDDNSSFYYNNCCPGIMHSFTITEDGTDVHKFIPVIRNSDDTTGFYDVCTNTFTAYDGDYSPNILPMAVNDDDTIDGVLFNIEDGAYSISGTSSNSITYYAMLRESIYIPEIGSYDNKDGYSIAFLNTTSIPSSMTIHFGSYDTSTDTFTSYQSYSSGYSSYYYNDSPNLRQQTINCIKFEISNGATVDVEMSPMLVKRPIQSMQTYYNPGKQLASSSSITVHSKQMNSLLSRIMVAGGAGGGWRNSEGDWYSGHSSLAGGGGAIGGTTGQAYNGSVYPTQTFGSYFGRGQDGVRKTGTDAEGGGGEGDGGGGGGWYGGYTGLAHSYQTLSVTCGSGGSGYVLTATSSKPAGYIPGAKYYFQYPYMYSGCSKTAKVIICKRTTKLRADDIIKTISTGNYEKITLPIGTYRLTCNGASGGNRWTANLTKFAYGGRASGTISFGETTDLYAVVGGCPTYAGTHPDNVSNTYNARFPNSIFNGGACSSTSSFRAQLTASGGATDFRLLKPSTVTEILTVPNGYTELEYLESEGGPYIDIDYIHKADTRIECRCYVASSGSGYGYTGVYGARQNGDYLSHVFFAQYAYDWYPCYNCNNGEYRYYGSTFPRDQIVTIITDGANASWYDDNGQLIDGWTNASGGQVNGNQVMRLFGLNAGGSYDVASLVGKMYSFKVYESNVIKCYLVPCKRNSDDVLGMYDIIRQTFYAGTFYNRDFIGGPDVPDEDKTTYEYSYIDTSNSLLSRILVAGGAGGAGGCGSNDNNVRAGNGGGVEGEWYANNSTYGTNAGPGTQTTSPDSGMPEINGGFGYGGAGGIVNGGYGGSGGGGWYGGCGTMPDHSGDDDRFGCGGSGYVLTEESYKPTGYIPDSKYYMTDVVNIQGGNIDTFGSATIEVIDVLMDKLLIEDSVGIKTYDSENDEWVLIPDVETITDEIIEQYGVTSIDNENGIVGEYDVYCTDTDNEIIGMEYVTVPNALHVTTMIDTPNYIDEVSLDCENFDANINYTIECVPYQSQQRVDITFNMIDTPQNEYQVYSVSTTSTRTAHYEPPIEHEKVYKIPTDLMPVGEYDRIPNKYNDYIPQTLLDGTTITKIGYVNSKIRNRIIYTLMSLNDTYIRLSSFNIITKSINVIFETTLSELEFNYTSSDYNQIGDFLIDDTNVYITAYRSVNFFWRIPLDSIIDQTDISGKVKIPISNYIGGGRICWYDDETFLYTTESDKHINFYSTRLQETIRQINTGENGVFGEIVYSGNYIISRLSKDSFYSCNVTNETITSFSSKDTVVCADDTRFFVVSYVSGGSDVLSIYSNDDLTLLGTITLPLYMYTPTSVYVSNNILYITFNGSVNLYICELKPNGVYDTYKSFVTMPLQYILNDFRPVVSDIDTDDAPILLGTTFKQYFFLPYYKLYTTNYQSSAKYNMGYKYNRSLYPTNAQQSQSFIYDPTYITFKQSYMSIHTGVIQYEAETYTETIKCIHVDRAYKKMVSADIRRED